MDRRVAGKIYSEVEERSGVLINLYRSGSDLYNWRSKDSDIDYRGVYAADPRGFLGLNVPGKKKSMSLHQPEKKIDTVLFELGHAMTLALKGNSNIVEEFLAPQICKHPYFYELKEQLDATPINEAGFMGSCMGIAHGALDDVNNKPHQPVKRLLYAYRTMFMAREYFLTGDIISDIELLITRNDPENELGVWDLLYRKREGDEKVELTFKEEGLHLPQAREYIKEVLRVYDSNKEIEVKAPNKEEWAEMNNLIADIRVRMLTTSPMGYP
jgi:predicted nucleotidyltransferase